ncbi:hypothetical protein R1flu_001681 [Riccia fluitans]|uniref:Uncharacterized protein n=1 Tax=Riccia fluitans TaxID=41844 RepID=A0ABD1Y3Z3_9MARC
MSSQRYTGLGLATRAAADSCLVRNYLQKKYSGGFSGMLQTLSTEAELMPSPPSSSNQNLTISPQALSILQRGREEEPAREMLS